MHIDFGIRARITARRCVPSGSPATVVAGLTARKAVRSGVLWGYIFGIAIASSEISYVEDLQDRGATRCLGRRPTAPTRR